MMEVNPSLLGMGLLYKQLQLLAEKFQSLLISLVMVKIYRVIR